jgi:hypothetical protein
LVIKVSKKRRLSRPPPVEGFFLEMAALPERLSFCFAWAAQFPTFSRRHQTPPPAPMIKIIQKEKAFK